MGQAVRTERIARAVPWVGRTSIESVPSLGVVNWNTMSGPPLPPHEEDVSSLLPARSATPAATPFANVKNAGEAHVSETSGATMDTASARGASGGLSEPPLHAAITSNAMHASLAMRSPRLRRLSLLDILTKRAGWSRLVEGVTQEQEGVRDDEQRAAFVEHDGLRDARPAECRRDNE